MDLRYPIGPFEWKGQTLTAAGRGRFIGEIAEAPAKLREALAGLSEDRLETPYRPGGWTVRQVAHHIPDSHVNAYIRFKLTLTETNPELRSYEESEWAKLADVKSEPVEVSIRLLEALHRRWVALLVSLGAADFARTARHPSWGVIPLDFLLAQYAWHGRHHVAHITSLRERMGWDA